MSIEKKHAAEPICTPTPAHKLQEKSGKMPTTEEVRESIRRDAKRLLTPLFERIQRQRGLPKGDRSRMV